MMFLCQVLGVAGRVALALAGSASAAMPVVAEYPRDTPAYDSFLKAIRVVPLADQSLAVIHVARVQGESAITATVLRPSGAIIDEWRPGEWLRQAAKLQPVESRLQTRPGHVGQVYSITQLPSTGQFVVSIGWQDNAGEAQNGIALLHAANGGYTLEKVIILPFSIRDLDAGPGNTIIASIFDALAFRTSHQSPNFAVIDTDGTVVTQSFLDQPASKEEAAHNFTEARVVSLPRNRAVFVSPGLGKAYFVSIPARQRGPGSKPQSRSDTAAQVTTESVVSLAPPIASHQVSAGKGSLRGVFVDGEQRLGVLYTADTPSGSALILVSHAANGVTETMLPVHGDLRAVYWYAGRLQTITADYDHIVVTAVSPLASAQ